MVLDGETAITSGKIPTHSRALWVLLIGSLVVVMAATMVKDLWLTGAEPNILFYILVPPVDILGTTLAMFLTAKAFKQMITFLEVLAFALCVTVVMQLMEIVSKLVWYKVWQYPGMAYIALTFGLFFTFMVYGLSRWTAVKWWVALSMAFVGLLSSLFVGGIFLSLTGLETPGS